MNWSQVLQAVRRRYAAELARTDDPDEIAEIQNREVNELRGLKAVRAKETSPPAWVLARLGGRDSRASSAQRSSGGAGGAQRSSGAAGGGMEWPQVFVAMRRRYARELMGVSDDDQIAEIRNREANEFRALKAVRAAHASPPAWVLARLGGRDVRAGGAAGDDDDSDVEFVANPLSPAKYQPPPKPAPVDVDVAWMQAITAMRRRYDQELSTVSDPVRIAAIQKRQTEDIAAMKRMRAEGLLPTDKRVEALMMIPPPPPPPPEGALRGSPPPPPSPRTMRKIATMRKQPAPGAATLKRMEVAKLEAARVEALRKEAERLEAQNVESERREAKRLEEEKQQALREEERRLEARKRQAQQREDKRLEAQKQAALREDARRLEAKKLEQEQLEADRLEAEKEAALEKEAMRLEAEKNDALLRERKRLEARKQAALAAKAERSGATPAQAKAMARAATIRRPAGPPVRITSRPRPKIERFDESAPWNQSWNTVRVENKTQTPLFLRVYRAKEGYSAGSLVDHLLAAESKQYYLKPNRPPIDIKFLRLDVKDKLNPSITQRLYWGTNKFSDAGPPILNGNNERIISALSTIRITPDRIMLN